jgi:hypothetical protein
VNAFFSSFRQLVVARNTSMSLLTIASLAQLTNDKEYGSVYANIEIFDHPSIVNEKKKQKNNKNNRRVL